MNKPFSLIVLAAFAAAALLASCNGGPDVMQLTVNGEAYAISLPAADTVDLVTLSTEFDADVAVSNPQRYSRLSVDGIALEKGLGRIPVDKIGKDAFLTLEWARHGAEGTVVLRTLHNKVPDVMATGQAASPGDFYLSYVYLRLIQKFGNDGQLLFYRFEPREIRGSEDCTGWWDFKKHSFDGKTYYSYHAPDQAFDDWKFTGYNPGKRVLLDERYRPLEEIHLLADQTGIVRDGDPIDGHDFFFFAPGHYIVSAYLEREGVYAAYLQEVQDGKVVFDWWSTDHPELAGWGDPAFGQPKDYVHFNSIDLLPDGNWLCSLRHVSSVVKIDRADGTGDILWHISGASPARPAYAFHGQHCARWHGEDSTISLYNNGNGTGVTGLLRLSVNPATGAVTGGGNLLAAGYPAYYSEACGALTFSGDNFIAGWGIPGQGGANDRLLIEFDAAGNEQFSLRRHPGNPYNGLLASYRCVKE